MNETESRDGGGPTVSVSSTPAPKATASFRGFTDAKGSVMSWEKGCEEASRVVMNQMERGFVEQLISDHCSPDEVLVWLVYPDTGEFA